MITIPRREVLDVISAADTYGYNDDVLMTFFAEYMGVVTDEEIKEYANSMGDEYWEEDRAEAIEALTMWRDNYGGK